MRLGDALRFPFRGPHAWPNIGLLLVCFLIPIIGPIVAAGFQCGVEKILVFNPDADPPRFDFGKFGTYLQRGVMPFCVSLLAALVLLPVFFVLVAVAVVGVVLTVQDHPLVAVCIILAVVLAWVVASLAFGIVSTPKVFRAGVEGVILPAFESRFILDFVRRVGWQTLRFSVQIFVLTLPVLLLACIPPAIYAVLGILILAQSHARVQLYREYLARGGMPLAIMPEPAETGAFPVVVAGDGPNV
jgi:hypothetical protein